MKKSVFSYLLAAAALALAGSTATAAVFNWNVATPDPGSAWNVNGNWDAANYPSFGGAVNNTAVFGITGTSSSATSIDNVLSASTTLAALSYTNSVNNTWHVTQIPAGMTLTVTGPVIIGGGTVDGGNNTLAAMVDAGTFIATGNTFNVGNSGSAAIQSATLDLSGLSNFVYNASAGTFQVGNANRSQANMNFAAVTNSVTAATMNFNTLSTSSSGNGTIRLGSGTNIINVGTWNVSAGRLNCIVNFFTADGGLRLRGVAGGDSDRANMTLGNRTTGGSAGTTTGTLSLNGHPVDMKFNTLTIGAANSANTGIGRILFDTGTIDATTIRMGVDSNTTNATGFLTVGANGTLVIGTGGLSLANNTSTGTGAGYLVNNGTITCNGDIFKTTSVNSTGSVVMANGTLNLQNRFFGTPAAPVDLFDVADSTINLVAFNSSTNFVVNTLNLGGSAVNLNFASLPSITSYPAQFPVFKYTTLNPALPDGPTAILGVASLPGTFVGYTSNDTANGMIWLVVTGGPAPAKPVGWRGNLNGNWDTSTLNWTNIAGSAAAYADGDFAGFDDSAVTKTVNLVATVNPGSISNNTAGTYTFGGPGGIAGSGNLDKQGPGTLVFTNSGINNFSGGMTIENGTLQFGNGGTNGNVPSAGNIVNNGALILNHSDSFTSPNVISGSGTVTQNGTGAVTLSGANTYAGATAINAGRVIVNNASGATLASSLGAIPGGAVTVAAGATLDVQNGSANTIAFTNNSIPATKQFNIAGAGVDGNGAIVNNGSANQQNVFQSITLTADATWGGAARWDMRGNAAIVPQLNLGGHKLTKTNGNQISLVAANVSSGDIDIKGGVLSFETTSTVQGTGTITVYPGGSIGAFRLNAGQFTRPIVLNGGTFTNLSGNGATNDSPITLAADSFMSMNAGGNHDLYLRGPISGSFGFTKIGTNALVLSGANTYTGITTISNGSLWLTNSGSIDNSRIITIASNAVLVARGRTDVMLTLTSGQTLKGNGTNDADLTVGSGATLSPSGTGTPLGAFTVNGTVTLQGTNVMDIDKAAGTNDLVVANAINYGGTLVINNLSTALNTDEAYQLFASSGGYNGAFSAIIPATPGSGLAWDTNFLTTDGTLRIIPGVVTGPTTNASIQTAVRSGTNIVIHGTNNNVPNTSFHYAVLVSTNLSTPLSNWTPVVTNSFNGDGTFDYSSPIVPGVPRQFINVIAVP